MKRLLFLFCILLCACVYAYNDDVQMWVDNINASNGHVTYTDIVVLPTDKGVLLLKARKDYVCSQNTSAILWVEGYRNNDFSNPIDISFMVDKTKLRKYTPAELQDYAVNIVRQYCNQ